MLLHLPFAEQAAHLALATTTATRATTATMAAASDSGFSWDLVADFQVMFSYQFMRNAFLAGTLVALVAGAVGYFMVLRGESFAGHTLANIGFAGAAGAVLFGITPVLGLLAFGVGGAVGIAILGQRSLRAHGRYDVAVGTVLTLALGLGTLFEQLSTAKATNIYAILFGSVLGVSAADVGQIALMALATLALLLLVARPLLFASVDPEVATARGVPVRLLTYVFLALLALAVTQAVQVVGVLLIFALLVTPAATAQQLTAHIGRGILCSILLALLVTWLGLVVAFYTPYPVGFFITTFAFAAYLAVRFVRAGLGFLARTRSRTTAAPAAAAAEAHEVAR